MKSTMPSNGYRTVVFFALVVWAISPLMAFLNDQNANHVLGQANFTSNVNTHSATTFGLTSRALYVNALGLKRLYVTASNSVVVYDVSGGITNGMVASSILGQPDFGNYAVVNPPTAKSMWGPHDLAYDYANNRLFVTDAGNYRVLVFNVGGGITKGMAASNVLGKPNKVVWDLSQGYCIHGPLPPANASNTSLPVGVAFDSARQRLFVSDTCNNRIMVYDLSLGISDGMAASKVLGQPDFTTGILDTGPQGFYKPGMLAFDPMKQWLMVADMQNSRVLIFDLSGGLSNYMAAAHVMGQPDFLHTDRITSQNGMNIPVSVSFDSAHQRLFVSDGSNGRVLVYNLWGGVMDGMNAAVVLGQPDFTTSAISGTPTASDMFYAQGVTYDTENGLLYVADGFNRITTFSDSDLAGTSPVCPGSTTSSPIICGTVTAAEDSSPLASVPVELLGSDGEYKATTKTDQAGAYRFIDGLTANDTYFITPAVGRTMSPVPLQTAVTALTSVGAVVNLQIRGWTSPLTVATGVSGTVVLISTVSYAGANAPALNPNSVASSGFYSAASASNGSATLQLPMGSYYVTCWVPQLTGETTTYNRFSSGPHSVSANQAQSISCL